MINITAAFVCGQSKALLTLVLDGLQTRTLLDDWMVVDLVQAETEQSKKVMLGWVVHEADEPPSENGLASENGLVCNKNECMSRDVQRKQHQLQSTGYSALPSLQRLM